MSCRTRNKTRIYQYIRDNKDVDPVLIARGLNMQPVEIVEIMKELKIEGLVEGLVDGLVDGGEQERLQKEIEEEENMQMLKEYENHGGYEDE